MNARIIACWMLALPAAGVSAEDDYWYGKLQAGFLFPESDVNLVGKTDSVYGGSPAFVMNDGGQVSFAIGRRMPSGWRMEAELSFLGTNTDAAAVSGFDERMDDTFRLDGGVDSTVLMLNGIFDLSATGTRFTPYLKAGIGIARNEASAMLDVKYDSALWIGTAFEGQSINGARFPDAFETSFAWNMGLGVRAVLTDRFMLALEYSFIELGEAATGIDANNDAFIYTGLGSQRLLLGLDFGF